MWPERGFDGHTAMNSLNHVVLGSVGEWMWRNIIGLAPDDSEPRLQTFRDSPSSGRRLDLGQRRLRIGSRPYFQRMENR